MVTRHHCLRKITYLLFQDIMDELFGSVPPGHVRDRAYK